MTTASNQAQGGQSGYTDAFGPNVAQILKQATRVVGRMPAQVRAELRAAVKAGVLGHLKKDGLLPEIFFHPDHKNGAIERQKREAMHAVKCIASVMAPLSDVRDFTNFDPATEGRAALARMAVSATQGPKT